MCWKSRLFLNSPFILTSTKHNAVNVLTIYQYISKHPIPYIDTDKTNWCQLVTIIHDSECPLVCTLV